MQSIQTGRTSTLQPIDLNINTERILWDIECALSAFLCCRQYQSCFVIWWVESASLLNFFAKRQSRKVNSVNQNNYTLNDTSEEASVNTLKGFRKALHQSGVWFVQRSCSDTIFRRVRKIAKKLLLASSCLSVRPHGTTRLPLDWF